MEAFAPIANRLFVLILQHPREKKEPLSTAPLARALLRQAALEIGLSWPNLSRILGRPVDPRRWGVLYLGSARPRRWGREEEVLLLDRQGRPVADEERLKALEGIVILDGSWQEAKALWWRNPWLLRLNRLALNPPAGARYGRLRRESRREGLSTIEAAALALKHLDPAPAAEETLLAALDRLIAETLGPPAGSENKGGLPRPRRH
jgi:tRNA-uridine aminocarboxypropyltransferase